MSEPRPPRAATDQPGWLRPLLLGGAVLLLLAGVPMVGLGLVLVISGDLGGAVPLCFGLVIAGLGAAGLVGDVVSRRPAPAPRLGSWSGVPALELPRATGQSAISAWSLALLGLALLLGALLAALADRWVLAAVLAALGVGALVVAQPHRAGSLAGGVWFTPAGLAHVHDGVSWELGWEDVHGALPTDPVPLVLRGGRTVDVRRGPASGRHRGRAVLDGVPLIWARDLSGGPALVSYVVEKAVADPAFRAALGTPASLPPAVRHREQDR